MSPGDDRFRASICHTYQGHVTAFIHSDIIRDVRDLWWNYGKQTKKLDNVSLTVPFFSLSEEFYPVITDCLLQLPTIWGISKHGFKFKHAGALLNDGHARQVPRLLCSQNKLLLCIPPSVPWKADYLGTLKSSGGLSVGGWLWKEGKPFESVPLSVDGSAFRILVTI